MDNVGMQIWSGYPAGSPLYLLAGVDQHEHGLAQEGHLHGSLAEHDAARNCHRIHTYNQFTLILVIIICAARSIHHNYHVHVHLDALTIRHSL